MGKVRWEEMFPDELLAAIAACPVCYVPYGLAEPHGAYNALGLDWLKATAICERAAAAFGGVVAPPIAWHMQDMPGFDFCGHVGVRHPLTSAIGVGLFLQLVLYNLRALDARGFHAAILVTGHYGGPERDMRLLADYYVRRTGSPMRIHAGSDAELIRHEDYHGDHAGVCETSQLLALRPELVDLGRREEESPNGPWAGTRFPLPDGRAPSRELGEKIVASQIAHLGEIQQALLGAYRPLDGWQAPTLTDVEALWARFELRTRKYWVTAQTWDEYVNGKLPPFPGWEALGE